MCCSCSNLVTQAEKHLQIRQEAERRYMAMLERACKMLADQILGTTITNDDRDGYQGKGAKADELGIVGPTEAPPNLHQQQRGDCSTESCLTSHESPIGMGSSPGRNRPMLNVGTANGSFVWSESDTFTPNMHIVQVSSHGIAGCGV